MFKITNIQQISILPITTTLQEQTLALLTEPFNDEAEAQQVWDELQCELWFLTSISDLSADVVDGEMLTRTLSYIEFEDQLNGGLVLTLSIIDNSGRGIYLLMQKQLQVELMQYLSTSDE
ncbi:hypothetical protein [Shewanella sp. 125m-1]